MPTTHFTANTQASRVTAQVNQPGATTPAVAATASYETLFRLAQLLDAGAEGQQELASLLKEALKDTAFRTRFEVLTDIKPLSVAKMPRTPHGPGELVVGGHLSDYQLDSLTAFIDAEVAALNGAGISCPDQQRITDEFLKIFSQKMLPELKEYRQKGFNYQPVNSDGLSELVNSIIDRQEDAAEQQEALQGKPPAGHGPLEEVRHTRRDVEDAAKRLQKVLSVSWERLQAGSDTPEVKKTAQVLNALIDGLKTAVSELQSAESLFSPETWEQQETVHRQQLTSDTISVLLGGRKVDAAQQAKLQKEVARAWEHAEPEVQDKLNQLRDSAVETYRSATTEQLKKSAREIKAAAEKAEAHADTMMNQLQDKPAAHAADLIRIVIAIKLVSSLLKDVQEVLAKTKKAVKPRGPEQDAIGKLFHWLDTRSPAMKRLDAWAGNFMVKGIPGAPAKLKALLQNILSLKEWDRRALNFADTLEDFAKNIARGEGKLANAGKTVHHLAAGALNKAAIHTIKQQEKLSQTVDPATRARLQTEAGLKHASVRTLANAQQIKKTTEQLLSATLQAKKAAMRSEKAAPIPVPVAKGEPVAMALRAVVETVADSLAGSAKKPAQPDKAKAQATLKQAASAARKAADDVLEQVSSKPLKAELAQALGKLPDGIQKQARPRFDRLAAPLGEAESQLVAAAETLKRAADAAEQEDYSPSSEAAMKALRKADTVKRGIKHAVAAATGTQMHNFSTDGRIAKAMGEWANETLTEFQQVFPEIDPAEIKTAMEQMLKAVVPLDLSNEKDPDGVLMLKRVDLALEDALKGTMLHPATPEQILTQRNPAFRDYVEKWGVKKLSYNASASGFSLQMGDALISRLTSLSPDISRLLIPRIGVIKAMLTPLTYVLEKRALMQGVKPGQPRPDAEIEQLKLRMLEKAAFRLVMHVTPSLVRNGLALAMAASGLWRAEDREDFVKNALLRLPIDFVYEAGYQSGAAVVRSVAASSMPLAGKASADAANAMISSEEMQEAEQAEEKSNAKKSGRGKRSRQGGVEDTRLIASQIVSQLKDRVHQVVEGETLEDISFRYYGHYHAVEQLRLSNEGRLDEDGILKADTFLLIEACPFDGKTPVASLQHTVMQGDTLKHLALRYYGNEEVGLKKIREANKFLADRDVVSPGETLKILDSVDPLAINRIVETQPGDTFENLSYKYYGHYYGADRIRYFNDKSLNGETKLKPGTNLIIPGSLLDGKKPTPAIQHQIARGDTLKNLASRYYGDEKTGIAIIKANNNYRLDGEHLVPGDVLILPDTVDPQFIANPGYGMPVSEESHARKYLQELINRFPPQDRSGISDPDSKIYLIHKTIPHKTKVVSLIEFSMNRADDKDYDVMWHPMAHLGDMKALDTDASTGENLHDRIKESYQKINKNDPRLLYLQPQNRVHKIVEGDSLQNISFMYYGHYHDAEKIRQNNREAVDENGVLKPGAYLFMPDSLRDGQSPAAVKQHRVMNGQSLSQLAIRYYGDEDIGIKKIKAANKQLGDRSHLLPGEVLEIPDSVDLLKANRIVRIEAGDTFANLSYKYYGHYHGGERIRQFNYRLLGGGADIKPGQQLIIPGALLDGNASAEKTLWIRLKAGETVESVAKRYYGDENLGVKIIKEVNQPGGGRSDFNQGDVLKIRNPVDGQYILNPPEGMPHSRESFNRQYLQDLIDNIPPSERRGVSHPDSLINIRHIESGKTETLSLHDFAMGKVNGKEYIVLWQPGDGHGNLIKLDFNPETYQTLAESINDEYEEYQAEYPRSQWVSEYVDHVVKKTLKEYSECAAVRGSIELNPEEFIRKYIQRKIDRVPEKSRGNVIGTPDTLIGFRSSAKGEIEFQASLMDVAMGKVETWKYYVNWEDTPWDLQRALIPDEMGQAPRMLGPVVEHITDLVPAKHNAIYIRQRIESFNSLANEVIDAYVAKLNKLYNDEDRKEKLAKYYDFAFRDSARYLAGRPDLKRFRPQLEAYLSGAENPKQMSLGGNKLTEVVVVQNGTEYLAWHAKGGFRIIDTTPEGFNDKETLNWIIGQMPASAQFKYSTESERFHALRAGYDLYGSTTPYLLTTMENVGQETAETILARAINDIHSMVTTAGEYLLDDAIDVTFIAGGFALGLVVPGAGVNLFLAQISLSASMTTAKEMLKLYLTDNEEKKEEIRKALGANIIAGITIDGACPIGNKLAGKLLKTNRIKLAFTKSPVLTNSRDAGVAVGGFKVTGKLSEAIIGEGGNNDLVAKDEKNDESVDNDDIAVGEQKKPKDIFYLIRENDTFESIAEKVYGDRTLANFIADCNPRHKAKLKETGSLGAPGILNIRDARFYDEPPQARRAMPTDGKYAVEHGDNMKEIAERFYGDRLMAKKILAANPQAKALMDSKGYLLPGMIITLPQTEVSSNAEVDNDSNAAQQIEEAASNQPDSREYTSQPGDTLPEISYRFYGYYGESENMRVDNAGKLPVGHKITDPLPQGTVLKIFYPNRDGTSPAPQPIDYRVPGPGMQNLSTIAGQFYDDRQIGMRKIREMNRLGDQAVFPAGTVLKIPDWVNKKYLNQP